MDKLADTVNACIKASARRDEEYRALRQRAARMIRRELERMEKNA